MLEYVELLEFQQQLGMARSRLRRLESRLRVSGQQAGGVEATRVSVRQDAGELTLPATPPTGTSGGGRKDPIVSVP